MYKEFYGLEDLPFTLTPDPRFIVFTPSYNEVLASLYYGLENAKGLIVLTGEVGTGKTTALRWILRRLDSSVLAAYVFNPRLSIDEFYHHVTQMLGIKDWTNKAELLQVMGRVLEERHRRGQPVSRRFSFSPFDVGDYWPPGSGRSLRREADIPTGIRGPALRPYRTGSVVADPPESRHSIIRLF